ncbi:MAG: oxidoreductase [Mogibacterium sp.]|nr:oxidoreductase [Mogibacterium sp.]
MKQTARIISTYSADAFGVCSALFELGGMTIMHDASGCNSTYTTHDEPRWFDMDSMVYISGLSEMEAIMGDDEKLIDDIVDAATNLQPAFIAICGTPIPMMTGFDFEAVAEVVEMRTGIPSFGFPTSGMKTYIDGASMALAGIARRMVSDVDPEEIANPVGMIVKSGSSPAFFDAPRVNILGLTPLDFSVNGSDASIADWLTECGFEVVSKWAMGSTLDEIRQAGRADVNLVVSAAGLGAAKVLYERFGIPYVIGQPVGEDQKDILRDAVNELTFESRAIRHSEDGAAGQGTESISVLSDLADADADAAPEIIVIGEGISSLALASAIEFETGRATKVLCATECPEELLRDCDRMTPDEDDIIPELEGASVIIADPLYQPICPQEARFIALPTEAFSGRIYRDDIPDLIRDPHAVTGQL